MQKGNELLRACENKWICKHTKD